MRFCSRTAVVLTMVLVSAPAMAEPVVQAVDPAIPEAYAPPGGDPAASASVSGVSLPSLTAQPEVQPAESANKGVIVFDLPPGGASIPGCADAAVPGCDAESPAAPTPAAEWDLSDLDSRGKPSFVDATCQAGCLGDVPTLQERGWADHVPSEYAARPGFWKQVGTVKTESLLFLGYFSFLSGQKLFRETVPFHFKNEGWFGKDTDNIGVDKLAHAFNTYLLAEFLHSQIHRRSQASEGDALTAAVLASGLMIFNEFSDGIESDSGWSIQDVTMNLTGAAFSVLRNTVPGLKEKVAFKIEIVPNEHVYSFSGKPHYEQQRFMFSIKGAGFEKLAKTPLRFLDLQLGYYASDFRIVDRVAGIEPKRHLFVGLGLNVGELLFGDSRSGLGKTAYKVLDYLQLPYTSIRYDTTGHFGY